MVDLRIATLAGPETTLQEAAIEEFRASLGGESHRHRPTKCGTEKKLWN